MYSSIPSAADVRRAYAAKQRYDALDARFDITGHARAAADVAERAREGLNHAVHGRGDGAASSGCAAGGGGAMSAAATGGAGAGAGERRWRCHAAKKQTPTGGRGKMQDAMLRQSHGVPMVMLEVNGEVVDRMGLPMGKDELKKGEMMTCGEWLVRVVGLEGAVPEAPRMVVVPPSAEELAAAHAPHVAPHVAPSAYGGQPALVTPEPTLATQPRSGLQAPGAHREYYREPNAYGTSADAPMSHAYAPPPPSPPPSRTPKYQIYEPPPRVERGTDPDTGERERWLGGGWRGRSEGEYRPRAVTQDEVDAARERLLQLEHEARIRAEVAASEAMERHRQAEEARMAAESAMHQMSQAEAANRAVRDAEHAAAEARRLATFAAEHQREAESQFISMLPIDDARNNAEEQERRLAEMRDIQRRIAEHERAASAEAQVAPEQPQYAPQQRQPQQQQPQQQQQQQQPQVPSRPTTVHYTPPLTAAPPSPVTTQRATAEIEYTSSLSNVKDRAAAFGHVTIKPKPASRAIPSEQTYSSHGTARTTASAHALAQVMRQDRAPPARATTTMPTLAQPPDAGESPEELRRKIEILERFAQSRGMFNK